MRRHDDDPGPIEDGWWFRDSVLRLPEAQPQRRILLVGAPPGSGRSRLVHRWVRGSAWTWVSLRGATEARLLEDVVEPAIRGRDGFVVLEEVEALSLAELEQVVLGLSAGLRLVLIGRGAVLPAALAVRLAGQVAEVRGDDLWWPVDVVQSQLLALGGVRVDAAAVDRIHQASGGWPAGVLALGRDRLGAGREHLADLAADLVVQEIPDDLADFVLATALIPGLTHDLDLCAALRPDVNPATMLDEATRWGLTADQWPVRTLEPLSHKDYHPFVTAAAHRITARQGLLRSESLCRAGEAASRKGRSQLAVDCFLAASAWPQALAELARSAPHGFRGWEMPHLHAVLEALPEPSWADDPESSALVALAAAICGDHLMAAEIISRVREVDWWESAVALIRALASSAGPTAVESLELPAFFGVGESLNAVIQVLAARAAVFEDQQGAVARHLSAAWAAGANRLPRYVLLAGLGVDALAAAWAGELSAAQRLAERASRLASQAGLDAHPMLAAAVLAEAEVLRSRGEPDQALQLLDRSAEILESGAAFVITAGGGAAPGQAHRILRARLLLDQADLPAARQELERLNDDQLAPALAVRLALAQARLAELGADLATAQAQLQEAPGVPAVASARLFLALQRQDESGANTVLNLWPPDTGLEDKLRRLLAEAAATLAAGRRGQAAELVNEALVAAEPDGHLRVFLDAPTSLRVMVSTMLRRSPDASAWRRALTVRLDQADAFQDQSAAVTRRELVVLQQLTSELTHAQIAAELFVSENTLKSHCRNLYRKLGVHSREEAVRIARVRGWLNPSVADEGMLRVVDLNITRTPDVVAAAEL